MATYTGLRQSVDDSFPTNSVEFITATLLRTYLNEHINQLGELQLRGVATVAGTPGTINGPSAWFASEVGTYPNFGGQTVLAGDLMYLINDGDSGWSSIKIMSVTELTSETVTIANGGTHPIPIDRLFSFLTITSATTQNVTIETGSGLKDIVNDLTVSAANAIGQRVDWDTVGGALTLTITCTTSVTLKLYIL